MFGSDGLHAPVAASIVAVAAGYFVGWPWSWLVLTPFVLWTISGWNQPVGPFDNGGGLLLAVFVIPAAAGIAVGLGTRFISRGHLGRH
jgi:hypothetical protein